MKDNNINENVVEVNNLKAFYITNAYGIQRTVQAVDDISLSIKEGEIYGLAGESGCGKSSLMKVMMGAHKVPLTIVDGGIHYKLGNNQNIKTIDSQNNLNFKWNEVSYIPQGSMNVLNPVRKIKDIFHDFISTDRIISKKDSYEMTSNYLKDLGLQEKVMISYPHQLSGGMRQRVTIALATILWPKVIYADEPTTALDVVVQRGVIQLLKEIQKEKKSTIILITHDLGVHANLAKRIGILYAGKLVEESSAEKILKNPKHPYTKFLINSLPSLDKKNDIESIPGRPPSLNNPPTGCRFHTRCPIAENKCKEVDPDIFDLHDDHRVACHKVTN